MTQRSMVEASLCASAAHDVGGPRTRHPREVDVLRREVDRLAAENVLLREQRAALADALMARARS